MSSSKFTPHNEYLKCAPSKVYTEGSCFTLKALQTIASTYNRDVGIESQNYIKITDSKENLLKEISKRISECNGNQLCWLDTNWVQNIKDEDIIKNTFRTQGPQGKFKWLNTTNINDIVKQYEAKYNDFKFLGAVPYDFEDLEQLGIGNLNFDELIQQNIYRLGLVINLDKHWQTGSHWVSLFCDLKNDKIYFFDSYGYKPKSLISKFVKRIALWCYKRHHLKIQNGGSHDEELDTESEFMKSTQNKYEKIMNIDYNKVRHQYKTSECGTYSVNFILRLLKGESFESIAENITPDDTVNKCREVYFRFE